MRRVKYQCKNCGWSESLPEQWADLKPKRCMNKKCNTSFMKNPESLDTQFPPKLDSEELYVKKTKRSSKTKQ